MDAPVEVLEARVAARQGDASDATTAVVREQADRLGAVDWPKVDARAPTDEAAKAWLAWPR
jgi:predicted kinase